MTCSGDRLLKWVMGILFGLLVLGAGQTATNYTMHTTDREKVGELRQVVLLQVADHENRLRKLEAEVVLRQEAILTSQREIKELLSQLKDRIRAK